MYPESTTVSLPLEAGRNRITVRLQALGVRDTRILFGIHAALGSPGTASADTHRRITNALPAERGDADCLSACDRWLRALRAEGTDGIAGPAPPPEGVTVRVGESETPWPGGQDTWRDPVAARRRRTVEVAACGQRLARVLEYPCNRPEPHLPDVPLPAHRDAHVTHLAANPGRGRDALHALLARQAAGSPALPTDDEVLADALQFVDARNDCADFTLAALLRLRLLDALSQEQTSRLEETLVGFRYWPDEEGRDAMCFGSENHALLFHGCQLLAGQLLPDRRFFASGRTGREQAAIATDRCRQWLDDVEAHGFLEFLSSTYMPITVAALMNLVDFADDEGPRRRAAAQVDTILRQLARHSFDGVLVSPQGRVYRGILTPETSGAQGLLSFCTPAVAAQRTGWAVFVASSPRYTPPDDLADLTRAPVDMRYAQKLTEVVLHKTRAAMLSSGTTYLRDPAGAGQFNAIAGARGYQEHAWHATLGRSCHVFVNHLGEHIDLGSARPGYWYGNGSLPLLRQRGERVDAVYHIPETHPVGFTHAHWPTDVFDEQQVDDHWAFGAHGRGLVALWCSRRLEPHDQVLTGRELRARGRHVAWACLVGDQDRVGTLASFAAQCRRRDPRFDGAPGRWEITWAGD